MRPKHRPAVLVEPPLFDCRAPHLGCSVLCAALRAQGHAAEVLDLNVRAIRWLLEPARLERARVRARRRAARLLRRHGETSPLAAQDRLAMWRSLRVLRCDRSFAHTLAERLRDFKNSDCFYVPRRYRIARAMVETALDVHAFACDERLFVGLSPQHYNGPYRATSLADLLAATGEANGNLFRPFFETFALPSILRLDPRFVGISISNVFQVIPGLTLSRMLRAEGALVVIGGPFFSKFVPRVRERPEFFELCDAVAVGPGEQTVVALARETDGTPNLQAVPNLLYRSARGTVHETTVAQDGFPEYGPADFTDLVLEDYFVPEPVLPIQSGRGCAWSRCTFCEIPQSRADTGVRRLVRDPSQVVHEMQVQGERHGARHFVFTDENLEPQLLARIAVRIETSGLDVSYLGYTRFSPRFDTAFCRRLALSGCRKLLFGLESGSQKVNDRCRKGVDVDTVPEIVQTCQDSGIAVHVFAIAGLPGENEHEAATNAEFLTRLTRRLAVPVSTIDVAPFYLNWNSWLRRHATQEGIDYESDQDFPLHTDRFRLPGDVDDEIARQRAATLQSELCWARSPAGFDLGYGNPLWPGWEEHTLLYLSEHGDRGRLPQVAWPGRLEDVLARTVEVADGLRLVAAEVGHETVDQGAAGRQPGLYALSPSAQPVAISKELFATLRQASEHRVVDLLDRSCPPSRDGEARSDACTSLIGLLQAGVLQW